MSLEYDVVLSFAGEDRPYVERVATALVRQQIRVFYDDHEEVELWGKDLYQHLSDVYRHRGRYCVIFASKAYAEKLWPRHELASAQARAFEENREYILPARFDETEIPGVLPTTAYLDLRKKTPEEFAAAIAKKVKLKIPPPRPSQPTISAAHASYGQEPPQRFVRRADELARPWNDPSVSEHERLARGKITDITRPLFTEKILEVLIAETDILQIINDGINYYFQCAYTYRNVQGYFYWDGSDHVQVVGNPDGSLWKDSKFQIGFFTLEHGHHRGDTARVRITKMFELMAGRYPQKFYPESGRT